MKKLLAVTVMAMLVLGLGGAALAQMGGPGQGPGFGPQGQMAGGGPGWGPGHGRGRGRGRGSCVQNWQGGGQGPAAPAVAIDEPKAKELAAEYVKKNLAGYQVEKIVKFERPRGTVYRIEAKGPNGEIQYLSINPFGFVRAPRFAPGRAL
ncbi:MAG: hypothetical protein WC713_07960 [Candidatus Methylomirabilota bacterium]